jgi:hypothetical protein
MQKMFLCRLCLNYNQTLQCPDRYFRHHRHQNYTNRHHRDTLVQEFLNLQETHLDFVQSHRRPIRQMRQDLLHYY